MPSDRDGQEDTRILAIIVTYHPDPDRLLRVLDALTPQVSRVCVIDNTPMCGECADLKEVVQPFSARIELTLLGRNIGIAAAQNEGIRHAINAAYDYVLLSDQDSIPDVGMVSALQGVADALEVSGVQVGCICPVYFDEVTGQAFRLQVHEPGRVFYHTVPGRQADPWVEVVTTISSGSLISTATLAAIGGMREDFFIDDVDTEWCLRARAYGFHNFATAQARLTHRLGDAPFRFWCFGWRQLSQYSPTRLYYRFRNFVILLRFCHVPLHWKLRASWYWLGNAYAYGLFAPHRLRNLKFIAHGIVDGLRGLAGPIGATSKIAPESRSNHFGAK